MEVSDESPLKYTNGGGNAGSGVAVIRYTLGPISSGTKATGGNVEAIPSGPYIMHSFTEPGPATFTNTSGSNLITVTYLMVGGGGGGGRDANANWHMLVVEEVLALFTTVHLQFHLDLQSINVGAGGRGMGYTGGPGVSGDKFSLTQPWGPTTITAPGGGGGGEGADQLDGSSGGGGVHRGHDLLVVEMLTPHLELLMQHLHQMDLEEVVVTLMVVMVWRWCL